MIFILKRGNGIYVILFLDNAYICVVKPLSICNGRIAEHAQRYNNSGCYDNCGDNKRCKEGMAMDKKFVNKMEKTDYERFVDFNSFLQLTQLGKAPEMFYADCSGITKDGIEVLVELKARKQLYQNGYISGCTLSGKSYTADTIYIESHKYADLMLDYVCLKKEPLFVNLLENAVVIFNLRKLKQRPKKAHKRIFSRLYQSFEIADREELSLKDAFIYTKNNEGKWERIYGKQ